MKLTIIISIIKKHLHTTTKYTGKMHVHVKTLQNNLYRKNKIFNWYSQKPNNYISIICTQCTFIPQHNWNTYTQWKICSHIHTCTQTYSMEYPLWALKKKGQINENIVKLDWIKEKADKIDMACTQISSPHKSMPQAVYYCSNYHLMFYILTHSWPSS
jgi:hypothetical protein